MTTEANVKLLEKIGKGGKDTSKLKVPTTRLNDNFRNILLESGFDKKATVKDVKAGYATRTGQKIGSFTAFNNYLGKINPDLTVFSNDPKTMVKVTNELNKVRSNLGLSKYTNVGITTPRSILEQTTTGTKYAEAGSKIPKEKVQKTLLEAQLKADKKFGVTPDGKSPTKKKLNFMAKYIQGKLGKTLTLSGIISLITKSGFGKAIPGVNVLSYAYDAGNIGQEYGPPVIEKVQEGLDIVTEPVASKMTQAEDMIKQMFLSKMNEGGMMNINYMTRPLGYKDGTRDGELVGDRQAELITGATAAMRGSLGKLNKVFNTVTGKNEFVTTRDILGSFRDNPNLYEPVKEEKDFLKSFQATMRPEKTSDTSATAIDTLRSLAASEVYNSMMNREGVDSFKIATAFLRNQGIPTNDQSINAIINLLDSQIIPQEQLNLMKEGQSTLGKGMDAAARGIEGLFDMLGLSDSRKFRDMDRNILKELKDMRTN